MKGKCLFIVQKLGTRSRLGQFSIHAPFVYSDCLLWSPGRTHGKKNREFTPCALAQMADGLQSDTTARILNIRNGSPRVLNERRVETWTNNGVVKFNSDGRYIAAPHHGDGFLRICRRRSYSARIRDDRKGRRGRKTTRGTQK